MADAETKAALKKSEFDPGSDAGGNGETGDAPARLDAEKTGKRKSGKIAKNRGEQDANDGETQAECACREGRSRRKSRDGREWKRAGRRWNRQEFPRRRSHRRA